MLRKIRMWDWHHPVDVADLERLAQLSRKWGLLTGPIQVRKLIYPTALR